MKKLVLSMKWLGPYANFRGSSTVMTEEKLCLTSRSVHFILIMEVSAAGR